MTRFLNRLRCWLGFHVKPRDAHKDYLWVCVRCHQLQAPHLKRLAWAKRVKRG